MIFSLYHHLCELSYQKSYPSIINDYIIPDLIALYKITNIHDK